MRKNKGVMRRKAPANTKFGHSRLRKRKQYQKALIRRRSQVPDVRRELNKYDGEKRGIRSNVVKSIKFWLTRITFFSLYLHISFDFLFSFRFCSLLLFCYAYWNTKEGRIITGYLCNNGRSRIKIDWTSHVLALCRLPIGLQPDSLIYFWLKNY